VGREGDNEYLVMEHLDGETLSSRLERGALSLEQTLEYSMQIADALDKAHRKGVTHRDLKPGNIMLTGSGAKLRPSVSRWWLQSAVGTGRQAFVLSGLGLQIDDDDTHVGNRCSGNHANGPVSSAPHLGLVAVARCKEVPVSGTTAAA